MCTYLEQEIPTLSQEVLMKLQEHQIDGQVFMGLNDEYLREVAPLLGDRMKLKRVINDLATKFSVSKTDKYGTNYIAPVKQSTIFCKLYLCGNP